ncbi:class I SAM-dependent methyltransferase [Actinomadura macrotermitis]|uniref:Class I SAM-dependent methyltransferase n=1 Tax=Actinomadura macrotermitis TaxID=2585200 RepID=A0A7K0C1H1_9ACTN|nr:class I SAM-dependent methyltransferase [Actinomadura macrotermitis]MQY06634.1 hypothetical protein [Actinomadura macrotermitis]
MGHHHHHHHHGEESSIPPLGQVNRQEHWLGVMWPFVRSHLPAAPGRVVEIGCGPLGGFVPYLRGRGYDAVGVDPSAPKAGAAYRRTGFEEFEPDGPVDAVIASTSLHHVADLGALLDRVHAMLAPGGVLIIIEWAWEEWDERTAEWAFARIGSTEGFLNGRRDDWQASGRPWADCLEEWTAEAGLHAARDVERAVRARFGRVERSTGPYMFRQLSGRADEEQRAIDAGESTATGLRIVAHRDA